MFVVVVVAVVVETVAAVVVVAEIVVVVVVGRQHQPERKEVEQEARRSMVCRHEDRAHERAGGKADDLRLHFLQHPHPLPHPPWRDQ